MTTQTGKITGRRWGSHTTYYLDGSKLPGPSTIAGIAPKDLSNWYAQQAAEYAIENWEQLGKLPLLERAKQIQNAPRGSVRKAAEAGTARHEAMEKLAHGETVPTVDPEVLADAEAAVQLIDRFDIHPLHSEIALANIGELYAGTADLIAYSDQLGGAVLLDHKFGKHVYDSHAIQLALYANATHQIEKTVTENVGPRGGKKAPTIGYTLTKAPEMRRDQAYIIHTRDGKSELHPVKIDGWVWQAALTCLDLYWEWETRTGWNFRSADSFEPAISDPMPLPDPTPTDTDDDTDDDNPPF